VTGCVALLVPLWIVRYPPLLDYPNHLASSFVLAHLHDPQFRFSEWYRADWALTPYVATDATLVVVQQLLPVEVAGRLVLSVCVIALPLSVWFFVRRVQARYDLAVLWAFVLAYSIFFLVGFLQYCLGIAACFAVLGLWMHYLDRPSPLRWIGLLAAATALFSVHLYGFGIACLIVTVYALVKRRPFKPLGSAWFAFLPGLILFMRPEMGTSAVPHIVFGGVWRKLGWLLALLAVHPRPVSPVNLIVFALFALSVVMAVWRNTHLRWNRDWLNVAVGLVAVYVLLPGGYVLRGNFVSPVDGRLLPFLLIVILAAVDLGRRERWVGAVAIVIFLVRMASLTQHFVLEQPGLARLAQSFQAVPPHARILPMWAVEAGNFTSRVFEPNHFWSYGVIRRGWISPYLFSTEVHALRLSHGDPYPSWGLWAPEYVAGFDWERVRKTYEYVWAYRLPQLSPKLRAVGELVFADEGLEIFKMHAPVGDWSPNAPPEQSTR
jgi:hypothetical protein